jgi:DNA polymerase I
MKVEELRVLRGKTFSLDTETNGLHFWCNQVIGVSIHCPEANLTEYFYTCRYEDVSYPTGRSKKVWTGEYDLVPDGTYVNGTPKFKKTKIYTTEEKVQVLNTAIPETAKIEEIRAVLLEVLSDPKTTVIMHNSKFDCHMLNLDMMKLSAKLLDTSVMVHLYDSRLRKSLEAAEKVFLGTASKRHHVLSVPKNLKKKVWHWPEDVVREYAINDAIVTFQLAEVLIPKLRKLKLLDLLVIDMEYSKTLWQLERRGLQLDGDFCTAAIQAFRDNLNLMATDLQDSVGYEFNWRSTPQLSKALYEDLNFPKPINPFADADGVDRSRFAFKGRYNKYCTSAFLLMEKANHPLGPLILDLREADKLRKTVEKYLDLQDGNQVIHTSFNQTGTRTGRLSSSNPNVQNIASQHRVRETQSAYSGGGIRQEEYNLRQAFKARPGYSFVSIDHAQQEQRLFAILANEPVMLEALRNRMDIHLMIAIAVWGDCGPERNKLHREWSKTISFGLLYGMTTGSLKFRLNKTEEEADEITSKYWGTFPRVQPWLQETVRNMEATHKVRYWSGRIWREDEQENFYKGCNAQIQGGAADLIKLAVIRAQHICTYQGWGSVVSIIHDEIMAEIKDEYVEQSIPVLLRVMELEDVFGLPFKAEAKIGKSYGDLHEIEAPNIMDVEWRNYLPPEIDWERISAIPWENKYGKKKKKHSSDA